MLVWRTSAIQNETKSNPCEVNQNDVRLRIVRRLSSHEVMHLWRKDCGFNNVEDKCDV